MEIPSEEILSEEIPSEEIPFEEIPSEEIPFEEIPPLSSINVSLKCQYGYFVLYPHQEQIVTSKNKNLGHWVLGDGTIWRCPDVDKPPPYHLLGLNNRSYNEFM